MAPRTTDELTASFVMERSAWVGGGQVMVAAVVVPVLLVEAGSVVEADVMVAEFVTERVGSQV